MKEIAFINELQAQNARIDALAQNQTVEVKVEERLAELAEERHKKQEQREAKEARAEERRKAMEEKRLKDMEALKVYLKSNLSNQNVAHLFWSCLVSLPPSFLSRNVIQNHCSESNGKDCKDS